MNENRPDSFLRNMFRIGTPECAVTFSVTAMILAVLYLLLGFWKTLFIAAFTALGAVAFGVEDKQEWLKDIINRLSPPRS